MELINTRNNKSITPFNGEKYNIWKARVRSLIDETIMDENALQIIDSEMKPDDIDASDWRIWNKVAKGVLIRSLGDSVISYATNEPNLSAREIFMKLDGIYSRKSVATELSMEMKLQGLKYDESDSLANHFMTFDELITDMESASGERLKETNKIARLLSSLPKSFGPLVVAIQTLNDKDLNLEFVKMRLLDHEVQIKKDSKDTSLKVLQVMNNNNTVRKPFKKQNKFKHFNRKNMNYKNLKCHHCGKKGHFKKNCFIYKKLMNEQNGNNKTAQVATSQTTSGFAFMLSTTHNENHDNTYFLLDSGATDHIINDEKLFSDFIEIDPPLKIAIAKRNEFIIAKKKGIVKLFNHLRRQIVLEDVLFCPEVPQNLVSVKKMQDAGVTIEFSPEGVTVSKNGDVIVNGNFINNLPVLKFKICYNLSALNMCDKNYKLWHERLGHISNAKFIEIKAKYMFSDVELIRNVQPNNSLCEACIQGKQARLRFEKSKDREFVNRPLFIIHSDVCGPISPTTVDGKNYYVVFIDQYTHYTVTYLISYKSDVFSVFKDFIEKSEAHFNLKVVNLYIDNGREYLSNTMKDYCVKKGISYHLTVPHTPQLNGVAERMIRTITEKARSMVIGAKLDKSFWGEAVLTACFIINRTPTNALKKCSKTPYEMWHNRKPNLKYLRVFGSTIYVHEKNRKSKFDSKSWKGIMVGYEPNGYKVWVVESGKFMTARDVIFDEVNVLESRPLTKVNHENFSENPVCETGGENPVCETGGENPVCETGGKNPVCETGGGSTSEVVHSDGMPSGDNIKENAGPVEAGGSAHKDAVKHSDLEINSKRNYQDNLRRSKRLKEKEKVSYEETDIESFILSVNSFDNSIPTTYEEIEARNDSTCWKKAIQDELDAHQFNNTWTIVEKPENKNFVDSKWVFTIKHDECGNLLKYKARLVARGFTQQYLVDYNETFAPVARVASFRVLLAFSNQFQLSVHHMDVKTAFLNGILKEEVYMKIPQGVNAGENKVCKLNKAIYGLKQAARCWFEVFEEALKAEGFVNSAVDRCIYILDKKDIDKNIYALLYVDDLIIATKDEKSMSNFKKYLKSKFEMVDLKEIKYFIGIRIERDNDSIYLSQTAYIKSVLRKFNMEDCKSVDTPMQSQINFEQLNSEETCNVPCRQLIGCLMYIMLCTRPDVSTAVNILSRYSNKTNIELWKSLKRILRYLKGSIELKLVFKRNLNFKEVVQGYVDSDWGGSQIDRRSTTGFVLKLFENCTVCWSTKKQNSVAASSTEAEYMALFESVREVLWLKSLFKSINYEIENPIRIFEDNQGCICIATSPTCHRRSKHIDIKYHFTREQVENKTITIQYIPTEKQLADIMTKPLANIRFLGLRSQLGLMGGDHA